MEKYIIIEGSDKNKLQSEINELHNEGYIIANHSAVGLLNELGKTIAHYSFVMKRAVLKEDNKSFNKTDKIKEVDKIIQPIVKPIKSKERIK